MNILKKLISLLLALMLTTATVGAALAESTDEPTEPVAEDESAAMTYEELEMYLTALSKEALASKEAETVAGEDGVTVSFPYATLQIADETLGENTAVLGAVLNAGVECPRGLMIGDSIGQLLNVYPNDNPTLSGTYYDAALYISGEKPAVTAGWVLRDGQRVTEVTHCVYYWTADGVIRCGVRYALDQGAITGIEVFGMNDLLTEEEAQTEIDDVIAMQEMSEYFAYPQSVVGTDLAPFQREDLSFAGIDLIDLTMESALAALGVSPVDEWMEDSTGDYLRQREWEGISILFSYDADKQYQGVSSVTINDDNVEGPRGVRVGDTLDSVTYRFRHSDGGPMDDGVILYGDGQTPPYGVLSYGEETSTLTYTLSLEDGSTVLWLLTFVNNELQTMNFLLR